MIENLKDIVVDTNIFIHANNNAIKSCESCIAFLNRLLNSNVFLAIDDEFNIDESKNTSRISYEYFKYIRHGSLSYAILLSIIKSNRIKQILESEYNCHKKLFNKIVRNKDDIIFLSVSLCTEDKIFITNDFEDFNSGKRKLWEKDMDLKLLSSIEL